MIILFILQSPASRFVARARELLAHQQNHQINSHKEALQQNSPKEAEELGIALLNLKLSKFKIGLYGKHILSFTHKLYCKQTNQPLLPRVKLDVGDLVSLRAKNGGQTILEGTISFKRADKIQISTDRQIEPQSLQRQFYSLYLGFNNITYIRYFQALDKILGAPDKYQRLFRNQLPRRLVVQNWVDQTLNASQKGAVQIALASNLTLIHGPPGTGKTKTVCEIISQAANNNMRVLVCAPSNIAVDNIAQRLLQKGKKLKIVRIGNPTRMLQSVLSCCLDKQVIQSELNKDLKKLKQNCTAKLRQLASSKQKSSLRKQIKQLKKEIWEAQQVILNQIIKQAQIVLATNTGAADRSLLDISFDMAIVDQCAQALQVSTWIPLLKAKKFVLAGDHFQLPPTVKSNCKQLQITLFDKLLQKGSTACFLDTQYRMSDNLMRWSNECFYQNKLKAAPANQQNSLKTFGSQLPNIIFINTDQCGMLQSNDDICKSKFNEGEALLTLKMVQQLLQEGLQPHHISIITPYSAQVALIQRILGEKQLKIQVSTVDGIQGRQNQCIIISTVRANLTQTVGFLSEYRRMNVAVTRAKRFLCIIGHSKTMRNDQFMSKLVDVLQTHQVRCGTAMLQHDERLQFDPKIQINIIPKKQKQKLDVPKADKKNKKKKDKKNQLKDEVSQKTQVEKQLNHAVIQPVQVSPAQQVDWKKLFQDQQRILLKNFIQSTEQVLVLKGLDGYRRKIVHTIVQSLGLQSNSIQTKQGKDVIIKKTLRQQTQTAEIRENKKPVKQKNKKKIKQQIKQPQLKQIVIFEPDPSKCGHVNNQKQCQGKINFMTLLCKFCQKKYCGKHSLAQDHGCGQQAIEQSRQRFRRQQTNQEQLRQKLKKINQQNLLQRSRKVKPKKGQQK